MDIQSLAIAVTATMGLVELLKKVGFPSRFSPLLSLVLGIGMVFLFTKSINLGVLGIGVITGLTASGFYSGVKSVATTDTDTTVQAAS